jgi:putative flippase GtrA
MVLDGWGGKAARYTVVGLVAFAIDYGTTALLIGVFPLLVANTLGFMIANVANFLLAHRWVFGHRWDWQRMPSLYIAVLGVSLVGLAINNVVVWVAVSMFVIPLLPSKIIATAVVMGWNFLARLLWIYAKKETN